MTIVILDDHDAIELTSILEFFAGWLRADLDYARRRLPFYGAYGVDDLHADTVRLTKILKATLIGPPAGPTEPTTAGRHGP